MKVFIHGVPDTPHLWKPLVAALGLQPSEYFAPALPGFGTPLPKGFSCTILLKNSAARARAFLFDRVQASFSAGCSLFSTVSRGVLEGGRRFRGVSGEFSEVLGGGSEEKFVIGSSGAA